MKKVTVERRKKYDHIVGREFTEEFEYVHNNNVDKLLEGLFNNIDDEEVGDVYDLKNGSYSFDECN